MFHLTEHRKKESIKLLTNHISKLLAPALKDIKRAFSPDQELAIIKHVLKTLPCSLAPMPATDNPDLSKTTYQFYQLVGSIINNHQLYASDLSTSNIIGDSVFNKNITKDTVIEAVRSLLSEATVAKTLSRG